MKKTESYVLNCPVCDSEVEICVDAHTQENQERDDCRVTMFEAIVCEYSVDSAAYYHCACGYQEQV